MRSLSILLVLVAAAAAAARLATLEREWSEYKVKHNKQYKSEQEELFRKNLFEKSKKDVEEHNKKYEEGLFSYTLGINQFSDMTREEYLQYARCLYTDNTWSSNAQITEFVRSDNATIPDEVDWRNKGAVTGVKNQHHCGSCWAFSTTGAVEGQHSIATGTLVELSEQNLIDCSTGNCHGGRVDEAFQYIISNGGIDTEASYPYDATAGSCRYDAGNSGATISSYERITSGDEEALRQAVATRGPVSVAIDATDEVFKHYNSNNIYDNPSCSSANLDHAVLVVGYGALPSGEEYWLVKNSWGEIWGSSGYIMMSRNKNNQCGIASNAWIPQV